MYCYADDQSWCAREFGRGSKKNFRNVKVALEAASGASAREWLKTRITRSRIDGTIAMG